MTDSLIHILSLVALAAYAVASYGYIYAIWRGHEVRLLSPRAVLLLALTCHATVLLILVLYAGGLIGFPFTLSLVTCCFIAVCLRLERFLKQGSLGIVLAPLGLCLLVFSSILFHVNSYGGDSILSGIASTWRITIGMHWVLVVIADVLFLMSFAVSISLVLQESALKRRRYSFLQERLPPIAVLDRLQYVLVAAGVTTLMLGAGMGMGVAVSSGIAGRGALQMLLDPRVFSSLITLALYLLLFLVQTFIGWRGRRAAWLSILAFITVVSSFITVNVVGESFHVF